MIDVDGIPVTVVRTRVKRLNLRVDTVSARVRVSMPERARLDDAIEFVRSRRLWIERHRKRADSGFWADFARRARHPSVPLIFGEATPIDTTESSLDDVLDALLRADVDRLVAEWAPRVGRHPTAVTIRAMTTRWGSCRHTSGRITLNRCLVHLPRWVCRHIVVHELVHLIEPNHQDGFYRMMDALIPGWREERRRIRAFAPLLIAVKNNERAGYPADGEVIPSARRD